jgi:hypothetical protein
MEKAKITFEGEDGGKVTVDFIVDRVTDKATITYDFQPGITLNDNSLYIQLSAMFMDVFEKV